MFFRSAHIIQYSTSLKIRGEGQTNQNYQITIEKFKECSNEDGSTALRDDMITENVQQVLQLAIFMISTASKIVQKHCHCANNLRV